MNKSVTAAMNEIVLSDSADDIARARTAVRDFGRLVFAEDVGYANLPRTCTVLQVVSLKYAISVEELQHGSMDVREVLRAAVHDVAMEVKRRGSDDMLVTYPDIHTHVEAGMLEVFAGVLIVTPNAPVSGAGFASAPVDCSADVYETRTAVESAMKCGQWEDVPRRAFAQQGDVGKEQKG